ncbi:hypothetical protein CTA2_7234, partial [Colletotrichum tanaceti]
MARRGTNEPDVGDSPSGRLSQKRSRQQLQDDTNSEPVNGTPSKRRRQAAPVDPYEIPSDNDDDDDDDDDEEEVDTEPVAVKQTPTKRRGRPPKPKPAIPSASGPVTPSKLRHVNALVTPSKAITPRRRQAADRSARRKSARSLIQSVVADDSEDDEGGLAWEIYESSEEEDGEEEGETEQADRLDTAPSEIAQQAEPE